MCDGMAADAEREFEVYERQIAELREQLGRTCSLTEYDRISADLARARPVVEAAGRVASEYCDREPTPAYTLPVTVWRP